MRITIFRAVLVLLGIALLASTLPIMAGTLQQTSSPLADTPQNDPANGTSETQGSAELGWVPSGTFPGFYAARDYRNLDPARYNVVGGHQVFYWEELEPTEGNYQWQIIDNFISAQQAKGKKVGIGIQTFNSRQNIGNPTNPPIRVPYFVFAAGAGKVICRDGFEIPKYWDPIYLAKYRNFIAALANRYDGNPQAQIEFVQIGVGRFGETQPCDDDDLDRDIYDTTDFYNALIAEGFTPANKWALTVNDITKIYADAFHHIRLLLPTGPTFKDMRERWTYNPYAINRGVGQFIAELYAIPQWIDHRTHDEWEYSGKLDFILDWAGTDNAWSPPSWLVSSLGITNTQVPAVAFEGYHYMLPTANDFFWGIAAGLSRHADYITLERDVLYAGNPGDHEVVDYTQNIQVMGLFAPYVGKRLADTPSVWVILRETGYKNSFYPQKGNYSFWLEQDDSIAQGRTVPTTYAQQSEIVRWEHWSDPAYCDPNVTPRSCINPAVETGQTFLGGPSLNWREGWICRRTDQANSNYYMWFKVDDRYRNLRSGIYDATITVTYFDRGNDTWQLEYDSTTSGPYKVAEGRTIAKSNTNTWRTATFRLSDARFLNGQLGGADFRINGMNDGNEYIHMVDVRIGSGTGDSYSIPLSASNGGWNLVSIPLVPTSTAIGDILAGIAGRYDMVQAYYGGAWHTYPSGDLAALDQTMGFWIHVTQDCTLVVRGTAPTSTSIPLTTANGGWNLVGWPSNDTRAIDVALASIAGKYDVVYAYDTFSAADPWRLYNPGLPSYANDLQQATTSKGYWIHMTTAGDLVVTY